MLLISHLKQPDPDVARELAVASGPLSFTALKALTPEVDRELAAHLGSLEPDAVAELLPATAAILVKHDGALSLKSAEPGDESLLVLSAYRGRLERGLRTVSEAQAQILVRPAGHLRLPLLSSIPSDCLEGSSVTRAHSTSGSRRSRLTRLGS